MRPNRLLAGLLLLLLSGLTGWSQVSYWFQGWQRKPDAAQAQAYFILPGIGIDFTYVTNRVIINNSATNIAFATNAIFAGTATNALFAGTATNAYNWSGSNAMQAQINGVSNAIFAPVITNNTSGNARSATNLVGDGTINLTNLPSTTSLTYTNGWLMLWSNSVPTIRLNANDGGITGGYGGFNATLTVTTNLSVLGAVNPSPYGTALYFPLGQIYTGLKSSTPSLIFNNTVDYTAIGACGYSSNALRVGSIANLGSAWASTSPNGFAWHVAGDQYTQGSVTATNGLYYIAQSNSVVANNVLQPVHCFAALMGYVTNTINGGANTYAIITNYQTARTNSMTCGLTTGCITNTLSGFYYCAIHCSMKAMNAGALIEGDLLLNGSIRDEISFQTEFDPGTPRYKGVSAFGILYIPANTQITFQIKSSGASGIEIRRAQFVVMSP